VPLICDHQLPAGERCERPHNHLQPHSVLPNWNDLLQGGLNNEPKLRDKVKRSPTETAGKGGEWGFLQNKVSRASKVAIPLELYLQDNTLLTRPYDGGCLVYLTPAQFRSGVPTGLTLGRNSVVLYQRAHELDDYPPDSSWSIFELLDDQGFVVDKWGKAVSWRGHYYVRIKRGSNGWDYGGGQAKAIGIRQDEYCSRRDQRFIVGQIAYLAWSIPGTRIRLNQPDAPAYLVEYLKRHQMLDLDRMRGAGMLNSNGTAQCPFCRAPLSYEELIDQAPQQIGRQLASSNATALHMMHIEPLKMGQFNHRPYNLGLGHAKCNHAQGEDSIRRSVEFLFGRRLTAALDETDVSREVRDDVWHRAVD